MLSCGLEVVQFETLHNLVSKLKGALLIFPLGQNYQSGLFPANRTLGHPTYSSGVSLGSPAKLPTTKSKIHA